MKKVALILVIMAVSSTLEAQQTYYWSNGQKVAVSEDRSVIVFSSKDPVRAQKAALALRANARVSSVIISTDGSMTRIILEEPSPDPIMQLLENLRILRGDLEWFSFGFRRSDGTRAVPTNQTSFSLKGTSKLDELETLIDGRASLSATPYGTAMIRVKDESVDIFSLANEIYESGIVEYSHPDFIAEIVHFDDPLYGDQYYLNNTGQFQGTSNIDINAPEGWAFLTGSSNIRVAVIDDGVEDHEDLNDAGGTTRVLMGFTPATGGTGDPSTAGDGHGEACAGIIAASHNNLGVRGVAPNVKILPVNIFAPNTTDQHVADAINWAWHNGADVLSNSWGYTGQSTYIEVIKLAIDSARTFGRGGKGTVVIFAAGNTGSYVTFPANVSGVVAVAAVDNNGSQWWYTARGARIDVVAPSGDVNLQGDVRTLDRMGSNGYYSTNYMTTFGGTSAACPQVAGMSALMLSLDQDLTELEVTTAIKNSAVDMGTTGRDDTFGFGRANAQGALLAILELIAGSNKSVSYAATTNNNNRVMAHGYGGQKLYEVFSSGVNYGGAIFFRRSTNNGTSWDITTRISAGDGMNENPSIAVHPVSSAYDATTDGIHVVWQHYTGTVDTYDIYYAKSTDQGATWAAPAKIAQNVVVSSNQWRPWPVVAGVSYQIGPETLGESFVPPEYGRVTLVAFVKSNGLHYMFNDSEMSEGWQGPFMLSTSAPGGNIWFPSIAAEGGNSSIAHLTYDARLYHKIYSRRYDASTQSWSTEAVAADGSGSSSYDRHSCVGIGVYPNSKYVVWNPYDWTYGKYYVKFRAGNSDNTWGSWTWSYVESGNNLFYPSVAAYYGSGGAQKVAITSSRNESKEPFLLKADVASQTWAQTTLGSDGLYAMVPTENSWSNFATPRELWTGNQSASPYTLVVSSQQLPKGTLASGDVPDFNTSGIYRRALVFNSWKLEIGNVRVVGNDGREHLVPFRSFDYSKPVDESNIWQYLQTEDVIQDGSFEKVRLSISFSTTESAPGDSAAGAGATGPGDGMMDLYNGANVVRSTPISGPAGYKADLELPFSGSSLSVKPIIRFDEPANIGTFASVENWIEDPATSYGVLAYSGGTASADETLLQNYPNPFNPTTTISYMVVAPGKVSLRVYDILGRVVATLVDGHREAGVHQIPFNASGLASGIYFYQLTAPEITVQRKMVVTK